MTTLEEFRQSLQSGHHLFADTLDFIARHYEFTPSAFDNNAQKNSADENQGSCRILALGILESFNREETLKAFGEHYRGVLEDSTGSSHANIRQLMTGSLENVHFEQFPLTRLD